MKNIYLFKNLRKIFNTNFIKGGLIVLGFSALAFYGIVLAGTITPPSGTPEAKFFTLTDIYNRLTTNATSTEGDHAFSFSDSLASSGHTLTEIYNAIPTINPAKLLSDTTYMGVTGAITSRTLSPDTIIVGEGFYTATTLPLVDNDLTAENIKSGTTVFSILGTLLPSGGDAEPLNVLAGKNFFGGTQADWNLQTGTMVNNGAFSLASGVSDQSVAEGYYSGGTLLGDSDLVAGNIASGVNIFGVDGSHSSGYTYGDNNANFVLGTASSAGTAFKNVYNGSATNYPQDIGGVDDYNAGGAMPSDTYNKSWTACVVGNNYCDTGDAVNADKKDNSTGLIWSKWLSAGTAKTWFWANNAKYPNGLSGDDGVCDTHNEVACRVVKLVDSDPGGKTGCDALGGGWRLPYQKELMIAYVDGSWGNLSSAGYTYWSSTTYSNATQTAWYTTLPYGYTNNNNKTNGASYRVRCVR